MKPTREEMIEWIDDQIIKNDAGTSPQYIKYLTAIRKELSAPSQSVEGWVLVPVVPTKEQIDLGWQLIRGNLRPDEIYPKMLAAAPMPPSNEWRPIESAPRDGTYVLATRGTEYFICQWTDVGRDEKGWANENYWLSYGEDTHRRYHPTHWLPLPTAPTPSREK